MPATDHLFGRVPLHRLFPDAYRQSCHMIRRDFAMYGTILVGTLLAARVLEMAVTGI